MTSRPPLPEDLEVYIESYDPQGRATYVSGYFEFKDLSLRFGAIMIEEYGEFDVGSRARPEPLAR